jgi:hypothetical protein
MVAPLTLLRKAEGGRKAKAALCYRAGLNNAANNTRIIKAGTPRRMPRPDYLLYALQRRHGTRMYSISSSPSGNSTTCPRKYQPS